MGTLIKGGSLKCPPVGAFPIVRTNSYGRMMISAQMNTHERLVTNATARTENNVSERSMTQMILNRKMEKWKPGFNELHEKAVNDRILARMIAEATHQSDEKLGHHIDRFRRNRNKNPRYKPSWLEAYGHSKGMAVHEELLARTKCRVESGPPAKAMQFRKFLRKCEFTQGGFPRMNTNRRARSVCRLPPVGDMLPGVGPSLSPTQMEEQAEDLQGKYSQMLFDTQMFGATNDDVRLLYAKSNKLPVGEDHFHIATHSAQEAAAGYMVQPLGGDALQHRVTPAHKFRDFRSTAPAGLYQQQISGMRRMASMPIPDQNPVTVKPEASGDDIISILQQQLAEALADWKVSESEEDVLTNRARVFEAKKALQALQSMQGAQTEELQNEEESATMSYRKSSGVSVHNSVL